MVNHAEDYPLAVLDPHSIQDINDVVNVDVIAPPDVSGVAYYRYDPRHRWYWMSNMTPDELIMFTQYDTHPPDGKYNRTLPLPTFFHLPIAALRRSHTLTPNRPSSHRPCSLPKHGRPSRLPEATER